MKLWIGTSGFQYPEWRGTFYPEKFPTSKMLPYYAERFSSTEVNYTFHRIPSGKTIEAWFRATPERFKFALKAPQKVTHFAKLQNCGDTIRFFHQVASDLERKLAPILFQLPPAFKKDTARLGGFLDELPAGMQGAFEFREASWLDAEVFELLRSKNIAVCIADSEKLTTPVVATASYGYLRLRREDYQESDVVRWAEVIKAQAGSWSDVFVYFKHEESGTGPRLAQQMLGLLGSARL